MKKQTENWLKIAKYDLRSAELNHYYSNTRYPDDFVEMEEEISEPKTKQVLDDTKGVFKWLEKKLN